MVDVPGSPLLSLLLLLCVSPLPAATYTLTPGRQAQHKVLHLDTHVHISGGWWEEL
ncbi:unnamed protein product [Oncorhynchus mykiss]|uniref:Uncharacterized protein n=1 Tax=Oncorhynchus mykiss TaxID=8022 RepID=A0A060Y638_ONCMY|nr:unnamed protein product [Oncorhynchus mykiss]